MSKTNEKHRIIIENKGESSVHEFESDEIIIGRESSANLKVPDDSVGRKHLKITLQKPKIIIEDLHSRNGTKIDGKKLAPDTPTEITSEQWIQLGKHDLRIQVVAAWLKPQIRKAQPPLPPPEIVTAKTLPPSDPVPPKKLPPPPGTKTHDLTNMKKELREIEGEKISIQQENRRLQTVCSGLDKLIEEKNASIQQLNHDLDGLNTKLQDLKPRVISAEERLSQIRGEHEEARVEIDKLKECEQKRTELEEQNKTLLEKHQHDEEELARLQKVIQTEQSALDELTKQVQEEQQQLEGIRQFLNQAKNEKVIFDREKDEYEAVCKEHAAIAEKLTADQAESISLKKDIDTKKEELENLEGEKKNKEMELEQSVRSELATLNTLRGQSKALNTDLENLTLQISEKGKELETAEKQKEAFDQLKAEVARLHVETDELNRKNEESRNLNQSLAQDIAQKEATLVRLAEEKKYLSQKIESTQKDVDRIRLEHYQALADLERTQGELNTVREEAAKAIQQAESENARLKLLEDSYQAADGKFAALQAESGQVEQEVNRLKSEQDALRAEALEHQKNCDRLKEQSQKETESYTREKEERDMEIRRSRAAYEIYEAEKKAERLKLEVTIEDIHVQKARLDREVCLLQLKLDQARQSTDEHEARVLSAMVRQKDAEAASQSALSKKAVLDMEIKQIQTELASEREEKQRLENEIVTAKERIRQDQDSHRAAMQSETEAVRSKRESEYEQHRLEQIRLLENELAQRKLSAERQLEMARNKDEHLFREQRKIAVQSLIQTTVKFLESKIPSEKLQRLPQELGDTLQRAFEHGDGDAASTVANQPNGKESKRARRFWNYAGASVGGIAAIFLVLAIFPQLPRKLAGSAYRGISSTPEQEKNNAFMRFIKEKGRIYQPTTTREYHETYTANILFSENYVTIKTDEETKKRWTLVLNDFFIGALGIGDRQTVPFVAREAVIVKELADIAKDIRAEHKDEGITRMHNFEEQSANLPVLIDLLGGRENYAKFRKFEKTFYDKEAGH